MHIIPIFITILTLILHFSAAFAEYQDGFSVHQWRNYYHKSKHMTGLSAHLLTGAPNVLVTQIDGQDTYIGAILFKFERGKNFYIASEAPYASEGFLRTIFVRNVHVYVSIIHEDDNSPFKLREWRESALNHVNHQHLAYMVKERIANGNLIVKDVKIAEMISGVRVYRAVIFNKETGENRTVYQILWHNWRDGDLISSDKLHEVVTLINKYIKLTTPTAENPTIMVNCFNGFEKTRLLISALHAYQLVAHGIEAEAYSIKEEYRKIAYGEKIKKMGEFTPQWHSDVRSRGGITASQYDILNEYCKRIKVKMPTPPKKH